MTRLLFQPGNKTKWKSCPRNNQTNFITTELILNKWWLTSFHLIKKQSTLFWNYIWANYSAFNKADILKNTILITHLLAWKHCQNNWVRDEKNKQVILIRVTALLWCSVLCVLQKKIRFIIWKQFFLHLDRHHASPEKSLLFPFTLVKGTGGGNSLRFMLLRSLLGT